MHCMHAIRPINKQQLHKTASTIGGILSNDFSALTLLQCYASIRLRPGLGSGLGFQQIVSYDG